MSQGLFASLYEAGSPFALVDARERRDHVDGHWFGSTNIPLSVLTARIARLIPDRDFPIHLFDWQDRASSAAVWCLEQLGYRNVTGARPAIPASLGTVLSKANMLVSFGAVCTTYVRGDPADYLDSYRDARLFNVRSTAEYNAFTIPGSQSCPNSLLLANDALRALARWRFFIVPGTRSIIGACTPARHDGLRHFPWWRAGLAA